MKLAFIGSGIGSLTTALLLSKEGFTIDIYEAESEPGGRLRYLQRGPYKIDAGPTIVLLPEMLLSILEQGGIARQELDLIKCDPLYQICFPDGTSYVKYPDVNRQKEELLRVFPQDVRYFEQFMKDMKQHYEIGDAMFLNRSFSRRSSAFHPKMLHSLFKLKAYQSVRQRAASYFSNEKLIDAYSLQTLYIGGDPMSSPGLYSLIPYSEHAHGLYYLKKGYAGLASLLKSVLEERGVRFHFNELINKIDYDASGVKGVRSEAREETYDKVIFNGELPRLYDLLGHMKKRAPSFIPSSGCFLLYYGLSTHYENKMTHQFFLPEQFLYHMKQVFKTKELPTNPSFYTFYPSAIDSTLAPEGHSVLYVLVPVPSGDGVDWEREKERFASMIEEQIEQRAFPEFKKHIVWRDVKTPLDAKADGLFEGGSFGIAPVLKQSGMFRPQMKPLPIDGLYAVGASIHPGGGIPIVMQGAKLLADEMMQKPAQWGRGELG
ncbi:phytoene desaturase family protein [Litoribacterium kuwaitense]|uniref:phytoene desaturase family protein n=1 Tax=Litoribacterium kuwaitense TaxID=1398745 RepID=UPI0028A5B2EF|nr:phytoene desaturase family protein [Litoribacterium kuwaitense]